MQVYLAILKAFLSYETYQKYSTLLDVHFIKENYPEVFRLVACLTSLHAQPSQVPTRSIDELEIVYKTLYPASEERNYKPILTAIAEMQVDPSLVASYLETIQKRTQATALARTALAFAEGQSDEQSIYSSINEFSKKAEAEITNDFIDDTLEAVYQKQVADPGLKWRLDSLNKSLGPLRKGDFGFIFARPETGKTTFLASEVTFMASQSAMPILWFNNEEQSEKVLLRCYQAALNKEVHEVFNDRAESNRKWLELSKSNIRFPKFESFTRKGVEGLCRKYRPSLIIFDQIDKIPGFSDDRNDLELSAIYGWSRSIAQAYGPVIGVCQAGSTAEGKKWLTMNDVNNSKTGKQGEADFILGIGKSQDEALMYERYFHLCKNKLLGGLDTSNDLRHNKWVVRIIPERARYEDI